MAIERLRKTNEIDRWMYTSSWSQLELADPSHKSNVLLLGPQHRSSTIALIEQAIKPWTASCSKVLYSTEEGVFKPSDTPEKDGSNPEWAREAWRQLEDLERPCIVFLADYNEDGPLSLLGFDEQIALADQRKDCVFYPILELARAYAEQFQARYARLVLLQADCFRVLQDDKLTDPLTAMNAGLMKVVAQEMPTLRALSVDVNLSDLIQGSINRSLPRAILGDHTESVIALRDKDSFREIYSPKPLHLSKRYEAKKDGYYFITGGRGKIGFTLAEFLARAGAKNLVLTGISDVVASEDEAAALGMVKSDAVLLSESDHLRRLAEFGCTAVLRKCDAVNRRETETLVVEMEERFGPVRGVIHAAGIFEAQRAFRGIVETSREDCERRFRPKINGAIVLHSIMRSRQIDFFLMQSSLSACLGGFGFAAYSVGNLFMDLYAEQIRSSGAPYASINWDGWVFHDRSAEEEAGSSVVSPKFASPDFGVVSEIAIRPHEGAAALERVLMDEPLDRTFVSTADLDLRYKQWVTGPAKAWKEK